MAVYDKTNRWCKRKKVDRPTHDSIKVVDPSKISFFITTSTVASPTSFSQGVSISFVKKRELSPSNIPIYSIQTQTSSSPLCQPVKNVIIKERDGTLNLDAPGTFVFGDTIDPK